MKTSQILSMTGIILGSVIFSSLSAYSRLPSNTKPTTVLSNQNSVVSGITGQVLISPVCPVVQVGVNCDPRPYKASISVLNQQGQIVARVRTNNDGKFKVQLKPGQYILRPESLEADENQFRPHASEEQIVVRSRRFSPVTITFDSGIR